MKPKRSIISAAFILSIFVFVLIFVDFLALNDINNDYVSTKVLDLIEIDISNELPAWASADLEWGFIKLSLLLKSISTIVIIVALAKVVGKK
ncbi:MAG: hypothetical protein K8R86_02960 [Bacteroidales bacterium]|nr:hypothetical protein [Bacteroidales bacterium]